MLLPSAHDKSRLKGQSKKITKCSYKCIAGDYLFTLYFCCVRPVNSTIKRSNSGVRMETIEKFSSIPIVESGLQTTMMIYNRVKKTNRLMLWGFEKSEAIVSSVLESLHPAIRFIEGPLEKIDRVGLKVLDLVEEKVPNLYLPPQMLYWNTKEYVADHVVKPVLSRADSFGDLVDGAIEKADIALDKYLPDKDGPIVNGFEADGPEELVCILRRLRLKRTNA